MSRRTFLRNFAGRPPDEPKFTPHRASLGVGWFTNALLRTHDDKQVRFYDDCIKGREVLINLFYANCESACPLATSRLVKVHEELKDRMGKNLFMYSMTVKPEEDDPKALRQYAEMHGALLPGWTFLTGDQYDIDTIRYRLFGMNHIMVDSDIYSHTSFMRIINDAANLWYMVDPMASMSTILLKISWADPPKTFEELVEANKKLQEKINKEKKLYGYRNTL